MCSFNGALGMNPAPPLLYHRSKMILTSFALICTKPKFKPPTTIRKMKPYRGLGREQHLGARAVDAEAADGGRRAHHPQLLVAPEQAQVRHEPVAERLRRGHHPFRLCPGLYLFFFEYAPTNHFLLTAVPFKTATSACIALRACRTPACMVSCMKNGQTFLQRKELGSARAPATGRG